MHILLLLQGATSAVLCVQASTCKPTTPAIWSHGYYFMQKPKWLHSIRMFFNNCGHWNKAKVVHSSAHIIKWSTHRQLHALHALWKLCYAANKGLICMEMQWMRNKCESILHLENKITTTDSTTMLPLNSVQLHKALDKMSTFMGGDVAQILYTHACMHTKYNQHSYTDT